MSLHVFRKFFPLVVLITGLVTVHPAQAQPNEDPSYPTTTPSPPPCLNGTPRLIEGVWVCEKRHFCGDDNLDPDEECDGNALGGKVCVALPDFQEYKHYSDRGILRCTDNCKFDVSDCRYCGDGIVDPTGEQCDDGNNIDGDGCNANCTRPGVMLPLDRSKYLGFTPKKPVLPAIKAQETTPGLAPVQSMPPPSAAIQKRTPRTTTIQISPDVAEQALSKQGAAQAIVEQKPSVFGSGMGTLFKVITPEQGISYPVAPLLEVYAPERTNITYTLTMDSGIGASVLMDISDSELQCNQNNKDCYLKKAFDPPLLENTSYLLAIPDFESTPIKFSVGVDTATYVPTQGVGTDTGTPMQTLHKQFKILTPKAGVIYPVAPHMEVYAPERTDITYSLTMCGSSVICGPGRGSSVIWQVSGTELQCEQDDKDCYLEKAFDFPLPENNHYLLKAYESYRIESEIASIRFAVGTLTDIDGLQAASTSTDNHNLQTIPIPAFGSKASALRAAQTPMITPALKPSLSITPARQPMTAAPTMKPASKAAPVPRSPVLAKAPTAVTPRLQARPPAFDTASQKQRATAKQPGVKRQVALARPVITYPQPNRKFVAPASFNAKANYVRHMKVRYGIREIRIQGQERDLMRSFNGHFGNLKAGKYCVYVTYDPNGPASQCVPFWVWSDRPALDKKPMASPPTPARQPVARPSSPAPVQKMKPAPVQRTPGS